MSQGFQSFAGAEKLKDSRPKIAERDETLRSDFSGTAFPTTPAPVAGQTCWRTDLGLQYRYDGSGWVLVPKTFAALTLASLKALPKGCAEVVFVAGKTTANDGWGGHFWWDGASSASGDDALVVVPDAGGTGRWKRVVPAGGVTPEMFGAVRNGSTADTTAIQAALDSGYPLLLLEGTYKSAGVNVPAGARIYGSRESILSKTAATGSFLTITGNDVRIVGITVDGTQTTDTYAGGFTASHHGIVAAGSSGTNRTDLVVEDCWIRNFGDHGIFFTYVTRQRLENNRVQRCGYAGIGMLSPLNADVLNNDVENIFPGNTGTAPYLNAYGIYASNSGGERVAEFVEIVGNKVKDVLPWEGIDIHNGKHCTIALNHVERCSQGIAYENHVAGVPGTGIEIHGNTVVCWSGGSVTKDGQTYYKNCGIVANGAATDELGDGLSVRDNLLINCGDARTSGANSGAVYVRNWRDLNILNNTFRSSTRAAIVLETDGSTNGGCIYVNVHANTSDGVTAGSDGVCRMVSASSRVLGHCALNYSNGLASGAQNFYQVGSPALVLSFYLNQDDASGAQGVRKVLTAFRTLYVRSDGNDGNSGLFNTAAGAFLTIQKAIDFAASLDLGGYDVTIQVAAGTWTQALTLRTLTGEGKVILLGDETTPANVTLSTTSAYNITGANYRGRYAVRGFKHTAATSGGAFNISGPGAELEFQNCAFHTCVDHHISVSNGASVNATGNYSITGGAATHMNVLINATLAIQTRTITVSAGLTFATGFCVVARNATVTVNGNSYSTNVATGKYYDAITNAVIYTNGAAGTYFPGGTAGTTATGGVYA